MAPRAAAEPAVVNLYDPATGMGSVWREEDAEAKLAEGFLTEAAWTEICEARAAEEYAAWLVDPETEPERFELLRQARDARLAATDYLVAPDYPLNEEQRAAVMVYRQSLRDLPAQEGAPWDGGGELTPWPEAPSSEKVQAGE
ncbi:MAG: phage tail assembly chaperone [Desulfovibrio sp.]|nr:phage tail assembly chaperone [Desulfovibrio sp.]